MRKELGVRYKRIRYLLRGKDERGKFLAGKMNMTLIICSK
jgi:hypothetical protein